MTLVARLPGVTVRQTVVSPTWQNNVFLLTAHASGEQILIDAADEPDRIGALIDESAGDALVPVALRAIVTTHQHSDHIGALADLVSGGGTPDGRPLTYAGAPDAGAITAQTGVVIDRPVVDGDTISVDGLSLGVIAVRGHTPGSIILSLDVPDHPTLLFVGDDLFPGGIGATQTHADFLSLLGDIESRVMQRFPDDAVVWPGHGRPTTIGAERPQLAAWRARGW